MASTEYPISLIIKAVDKATGPLRAINAQIQQATAPVRALSNSFKGLSDAAGLGKIGTSAVAALGSLKDVGRELVSLSTKLTAIGLAASYGLYRIVRGAVDAGDKLSEMAQRVGLSVDSFAQLQFAAEQSDISAEGFASAMDQLNKRLGEAKADSGALLEFLYKVSPAFAVQIKNAKGTEEAMNLLARAFEKIIDPSRRAALSAAAFGKGALNMGQFLGQGKAALDAYRQRFVELAGSQEQFAKDSSDADNALRETETALLGLRNSAIGAIMPALSELAKALANIVAGNRQNLAAWAREVGAALSEWVRSGGLERLVAAMGDWARIIGTVFDALGGLRGLLVIVGAYLSSGFITSVVAAAKAIGAFGLTLATTPLGLFLVTATAVAAAGYAIYKSWNQLGEIFTTWTGLVNALRAELDLLLHPLESLKTAGEWWSKQLGFSSGAPAGGQPLLSGGPGSSPAPGRAAGTEARVKVEFSNIPRGARVTADPASTAPVDLSMGYSMVGP